MTDIASGRYPVGGHLPSETQLCEETSLARGTVRQALSQLEHLGIIRRRQGAPSMVVSTTPLPDYQPVFGSTDELVTLAMRTHIERKEFSTVRATKALGKRLGVRPGSTWHLVQGARIRLGSRQPPICWSEQYLATSIPRDELDALLSGKITPEEAASAELEQVVRAEPLAPELAAKLESDCTTALVVVRRRRDARGRVLSVGIHTHPADRYELRTVIAPRIFDE
jgi:DNA-binding GntR family transcriptional regulator